MSAEENLIVDWTACEGRGLCVDLLPELLESDPWGYPKARHEGQKGLGVVPQQLNHHARSAVKMCPRLALRIETVSN